MKTIIKKVDFNKEVDTKFGTRYQFNVWYNDRKAQYLSNTKEQKAFIQGKESEFVETTREYNGVTYYNLKLPKSGSSNFARAIKREQSKYSGFAMSYAKDLVIADKIKLEDISEYTELMFKLMVKLDKTIEA